MNSIEFPLLDRTTQTSVISTTSNDLSNWSRLSSLWPLLYGTSCCFIEFASLIGSRFYFDRYGLVPRSSPRQADFIFTAGTVTMKMAPSLVRLYEQMPEPKYVIAMGACTITGGMFSTDSYSTVRGVDKFIPVDVYLPGCPRRFGLVFRISFRFVRGCCVRCSCPVKVGSSSARLGRRAPLWNRLCYAC